MEEEYNRGVQLRLHSWPLSDCSGRLRIALNYKQVKYETINVDILNSAHKDPRYKSVNAASTVPTLTVTLLDGRSVTLNQSIAAVEYVEEKFSGPHDPLLPDDVEDRARVRTLMNIFGTDVHPLLTHRVASAIAPMFPDEDSGHANAGSKREWNMMWISKGLDTYETALQSTAGKYSFGDGVTLADVVFLPTTWTAMRMGMDLGNWPKTKQVHDNLMELQAFQDAKQEL